MMIAHGTVFLGKAKPLAKRAADGTFMLTLQVVDSMGAFKKEPWTLHHSGPPAERFWDAYRAYLTPGQPLSCQVYEIRVFTNARVPGIDAHVIHLALAPRAQNTQQTNQPETTAP